MSCNWNEYNLNTLTRNNWRASLVPAAAVIPAPIAYAKVVAVKKLVVGPGRWFSVRLGHRDGAHHRHIAFLWEAPRCSSLNGGAVASSGVRAPTRLL